MKVRINARINANTALLRRYLEVDDVEVVYCETSTMGGVQHIAYKDIDAVLRDHANLSIQVGQTIFKLPYSATNREHTQAVAILVAGFRATLRRPPA